MDNHINSYTNILFENRNEYVKLLNNIDNQYKMYLESLFSSCDEIKNIIFAEAPPLIKNSKNVLTIKYIFDDLHNVELNIHRNIEYSYTKH